MIVPRTDIDIKKLSDSEINKILKNAKYRYTTFDFLINKHERNLPESTVESMKKGRDLWEQHKSELEDELKQRGI